MHVTNNSNNHTHNISDPKSGFTDTAWDGHRHSLNIPGCSTCRKTRRAVVAGVEKVFKANLYPTNWVKGHLHYYSSDILDEIEK